MKKLFLILMSMLFVSSVAYARSNVYDEHIIMENIDLVDTSSWDDFLKEIVNMDDIPTVRDINAGKLIKDIALNRYRLSGRDIVENIKYLLFKEIRYNYKLLIELLIIAILCGVINSFTDAFEDTSIGDIAYFACYITIVTIIFRNVMYILQIGRQAIENMVAFMHIVFPSLLALILAIGGVNTSAILQPHFMLIVGFVGSFLKSVILPLIFFSSVLSIISNIDSDTKLTNLKGLVNNVCSWMLGITFTIFIGVMVIQGVVATTFDGISIRTTKYAIESFVPIVGGLFSQTVDTIIGCSIIVKNAVGVAGLLVIGMICLVPSIKIFSILMVYKVSSALIELISDKRIANCLSDMSEVMVILLVTVLGIALIFSLLYL